MEIAKLTPVVIKVDKNKNKYVAAVSREPSPNNIYLVTASDEPDKAEFGLMLNEVNIQSAYFTLENTDLSKIVKGKPITLKSHRMFILNEDNDKPRWLEVSNHLPDDPFDYLDYNSRYAKLIMEKYRNELPAYYSESNIRSIVIGEYSIQPQFLNMLFFAPKTTYNKFQKNISFHGLRFIDWMINDIKRNPFNFSLASDPIDKIEAAYKEVGDGGQDQDGYYYYKRHDDRKLSGDTYIVRKRSPAIKVNFEFNQFNINNGVYRVKINDEYEYFAPNLLSNSETVGKALGLTLESNLLKANFELKKNQVTPTYQDLIVAMQPLMKSQLEKNNVDIERLDSDLNWVSISSIGVYGQNNQELLIADINTIITPNLSEWGEKKMNVELDGTQHKLRFNMASRLIWGVDLERLTDCVYSPYYTVCKKLHFNWVRFCNERNVKIVNN